MTFNKSYTTNYSQSNKMAVSSIIILLSSCLLVSAATVCGQTEAVNKNNSDKSETVQRDLCGNIVDKKPENAAKAIKDLRNTTQDKDTRVKAARFICGINSAEADQALNDAALNDSEIGVRQAAFHSLSRKLKKEEFFQLLTKALKDQAPEVRIEVLFQLAYTKNNRASELLIKRLQTDENAKVREAAIQSLSLMKQVIWEEPADTQTKVTEALLAALNDSDSRVRSMAVIAMPNILGEKSFEYLMLALKNPDPSVRGWAAHSLANSNVRKAIEPLTAMLAKEKDPTTRSEAERALRRLQTVSQEKAIANNSCLEKSCIAVKKAYISHFTELECSGEEYYYTPYFNYDGVRRSWDGRGLAGTKLQTVTSKSYKDSSGVCYNQWPEGSTLIDFVKIYRP